MIYKGNYEITETERRLSQLVVKGNGLIQEKRYQLTTTQQKFLAYVISLIKPGDTIDTMYEVHIEDFCNLCGIKKENFYEEFKRMIDKFDESAFWVDTKDELYKFRWFNDTRYIKRSGKVQLYLSRALKDYLIGMLGNFTQYELYNVMSLRSKYAIRLYELFKSYEYQERKRFYLDDLKHLLYAGSYKNFKDFRVRVLEPAIEEINKFTDIEVKYDLFYRGKKVHEIEFIIERKQPLERWKAFNITKEKIDRLNGQLRGQINIYDIPGVVPNENN